MRVRDVLASAASGAFIGALLTAAAMHKPCEPPARVVLSLPAGYGWTLEVERNGTWETVETREPSVAGEPASSLHLMDMPRDVGTTMIRVIPAVQGQRLGLLPLDKRTLEEATSDDI